MSHTVSSHRLLQSPGSFLSSNHETTTTNSRNRDAASAEKWGAGQEPEVHRPGQRARSGSGQEGRFLSTSSRPGCFEWWDNGDGPADPGASSLQRRGSIKGQPALALGQRPAGWQGLSPGSRRQGQGGSRWKAVRLVGGVPLFRASVVCTRLDAQTEMTGPHPPEAQDRRWAWGEMAREDWQGADGGVG